MESILMEGRRNLIWMTRSPFSNTAWVLAAWELGEAGRGAEGQGGEGQGQIARGHGVMRGEVSGAAKACPATTVVGGK